MKRMMYTAVAALCVAAPAAAQTPVTASAGGLTLEAAIETALEANPELQVSRLELQRAGEQVQEAWGNVFPVVNLSSSYTRSLEVPVNFLPARIFDPTAAEDDLIAVQFGAENSWAFQVRADQPLFQATAFIGVGAAARYRALQEEVLRGKREEIATRVRMAYNDVLLSEAAAALNARSVERIREALQETRALRSAGLASEYDVLRLEVQLANVEPGLRRAEDAVAAAKRSLAVQLGMEPTDSLRLEGSLVDAELPPVGGPAAVPAVAGADASAIDELVELAVEHRTDLEQLRLTEALRTAELRAEQAGYLPTVSLFGTYSLSAQENGAPDFFGPDGDSRGTGKQVGVQVSMPLFSGFKRPARVEQKELAVRQARVQFELARARAEDQVRTLADRIVETRSRTAAQRLAVRQARRGYEIARARYREGTGSRIDLTDAEVALRQSEFNYAQAVYDYLAARAQLDQAIGRVPLVDVETVEGLQSTRTSE